MSVCRGGGYEYARTEPQHPLANERGLYPLHRVVAENKIGRRLKKGEIVHHVDGNKFNNAPENLEVMTNSDHAKHHAKQADPISTVCGICKKMIFLLPHTYRLRIKRAKGGKIYCSLRCAGKRPS